ncbi:MULTISPECIES: tRNA (adenosine(37)-N6)-threonylcarbamoyltransferase complex transferase subunit TsaD [Prochlorococcus]|uniref:tRNA N6-adenosine threonylcarbamoyltransferase n=1 Tax=Prochlorococcus marinus (strain SARG / CCMP1375 / SS120) TaxID=167539 RepID=TSAD_PROMA|nr:MULTISPECIES: tRNA (adenosine(37)-N6)-threonylcarbamoyltransferase complex transferase subunit TsaD [Prochlorococcus]Q7VDB5.1 RecName: Full=tRNA N6-adenosine threonylcarbamoyltransferase; AltName: Full=N6-L-threonylcarbamoyladenine synthase; Short=t(6)A synthase; AltName: Full=t(6)A37 threonylcarbamoyladenosine biosynthesis protein TsaD; AltName: Full=tRNA threonylcarbamoyladenosine biosynthesis protein TsaD [Prochlorococcus marinus subsp. marinus str. CCMP1375]AAP99513.1 Metal-dependent prote
MQTVLSLETSCDESAAALVKFNEGKFEILANSIASQANEHAKWGGVVPEIASRRHLESLPFLIQEVFSQSGINFSDVNAIAATVAPGLSGALLVGSVTARTLSCLHDLPFLGIHHLEGHLCSALLSENPPVPPYLVLLVSGGHTELIQVDRNFTYKRVGRSHDDAAGEAFDKVARLLGLSYPGGPAIEKFAKKGDPASFHFPKGRVSKPEGGFYPYDFSFSGLKTAVLRKVESIRSEGKQIPLANLAASFENVVSEVLVERSVKYAFDHGLHSLVMVGGVAANTCLRKMMVSKAEDKAIDVYMAPKAFCTDNAAMIGTAALVRLISGTSPSSLELGVSARFELDQSDLLYKSEPPF